MNSNLKPEEEIIFQVRINRKTENIEFVKVELSPFEQATFELFLQTYIEKTLNNRVEDFYIEENE